MKKLLLLLSVACAGIQSYGQLTWQPTSLTSVNYLPVSSIESHNNELYATVFNGSTATLSKLDAGNASWTLVPTGSITVPRFLQSAGTRLYMSSINSGVYSMLYYTYDGANFILDTVGIGKSFSGISLVSGIQYTHGKVIVNAGSYYIKDTGDVAWRKTDVPTALNGGIDPLIYLNDTLYAYDNTGAHALYMSPDWGHVWNVVTTDLPSDFGTSRLVGDPVSGRLYAGGAWNGSTQTGLYYSDNGGKNWTLANLAAFINKNANNTPQQITSIYASGQSVYLALENNKNGSAPDILGSATGIAGLAYDTAGLPANAAAGVNGVKFLTHKGQLVLSLNVIDVYLKGTGSTGIKEHTAEAGKVSLFPNPVHDVLHIGNAQNQPFTSVKIMDATGKLVMSQLLHTADVPVADLPEGIYFIRLSAGEQTFPVQRFLKH